MSLSRKAPFAFYARGAIVFVSVDLEIALAARDIRAVSVNDQVVGYVSVGHGSNVGARLAIDLGRACGRAGVDRCQRGGERGIVRAVVVHGVGSEGGVGQLRSVEGVVRENGVKFEHAGGQGRVKLANGARAGPSAVHAEREVGGHELEVHIGDSHIILPAEDLILGVVALPALGVVPVRLRCLALEQAVVVARSAVVGAGGGGAPFDGHALPVVGISRFGDFGKNVPKSIVLPLPDSVANAVPGTSRSAAVAQTSNSRHALVLIAFPLSFCETYRFVLIKLVYGM